MSALDLTFTKGDLQAEKDVVAYVARVGEVPGGVAFALYAEVPEGAEAGDVVEEPGHSVLATKYARPTETGDYVVAHLAFVPKGATFDVMAPRDLVVVSRVGEDTKARYCGHAACVARHGGKHIPDRIDKVGATYCKGREGDGDKTRKGREAVTPVEEETGEIKRDSLGRKILVKQAQYVPAGDVEVA